METHDFTRSFEMGGLLFSPTHIRIERLALVIAAHRHSNSSYELHYTASGRGRVYIDETVYNVEPGTAYVTGPNVLHTQISDADDPVLEYCLYLNCRPARRMGDVQRELIPFQQTGFWIGANSWKIGTLLRDLLEERREARPDMEEMTEALIRQIVVVMNRSCREFADDAPNASGSAEILDESRFYPLVEDAFFYHYQTLRLSDLARMLNLSSRQVQRFLLNHYGKSFTQKRVDAQMAAAAELLRSSNLSITEIGEKTGFSSVEHFSTAFRRYYHCSPSAFRRRFLE